MTEGLVNGLCSRALTVRRAGTRLGQVRSPVVRAMAGSNIGISNQSSKSLDVFEGQETDHAVRVCSNTADTRPFFPRGKEELHHGFVDPSRAGGSEEERLSAFWKSRNEIHKWMIDNRVLARVWM